MKRKSLFVTMFLAVVCLLMLSLTVNACAESTDVWIDTTKDNSISIVTGVVHLTGNVGTAAGYNPGKTVYSEQISVSYSTPKTSEVQEKIDEARTMIRAIVDDLMVNAEGEYHYSMSEKTERKWDHRKYETVFSSVVLDGQTYDLTQNPDNSDLYEYSDGSVTIVYDYYENKLTKNNIEQAGTNYKLTRTHIASGDYGIETSYCVEVAGWISKPDPVVNQITVSGGVYKLNHSKLTATFIKPANKNAKKLTIPNTISANGKKYKVTEIKAKACSGMKKLTTVTIGANVKKIGAQAFAKCKKLGKITIKNAKMAKGGFGSKCFSNIKAKATFKVPKKMVEKYKDWIIKKGKAPKDSKVKK